MTTAPSRGYSRYKRAIGQRRNLIVNQRMTDEDKSVVWAFVGSLMTVKLVTSILILYYFPTWHALVLVVALSLLWFVPPVAYLATTSQMKYRLFKVRLRRKELLRQEWDVGERSHTHRR